MYFSVTFYYDNRVRSNPDWVCVFTGGVEVAGSNPVSPTYFQSRKHAVSTRHRECATEKRRDKFSIRTDLIREGLFWSAFMGQPPGRKPSNPPKYKLHNASGKVAFSAVRTLFRG